MKLLINAGDFEIIATSSDLLETIKKAGCTCYQSEQRTTKSAVEFVKMLRKRGHWSMFDHVSVTVWFKNVSRGFCYDDQTEVLTLDGWKLFKDTTNEDEFFTFDIETLENAYQQRTNYIEENWDGELIHGTNEKIDFAVTPNHTMIYGSYHKMWNYTWEKGRASDLYGTGIKLLWGSSPSRGLETRLQAKDWSKQHYKGKVYCVTIPYGTLYVRRNGKTLWSHNTHELVRHRLAAFAQSSTRYVDPTEDPKTGEPGVLDLEVVCPPHRDPEEFHEVESTIHGGIKPTLHRSFEQMAATVEDFYRALRKDGWAREDARQILPIGTKSDIVMTADMTEWRHVFALRTQRAAHWEIRSVMCKLLETFKETFSPIFDDYERVGEDDNGIPYYEVKGKCTE